MGFRGPHTATFATKKTRHSGESGDDDADAFTCGFTDQATTHPPPKKLLLIFIYCRALLANIALLSSRSTYR